MKIAPGQIAAHIGRKFEPLILIKGDDPLLCEEAADPVREWSRTSGFGEHRRYVVDGDFDWNAFFSEAYSPSLFAPRMIYELRLEGGKVGAVGSEILDQLAKAAPGHMILMVIAVKLDRSVFEASWAQVFENRGLLVVVERPEGRALHLWIRARMEGRGLQPSEAAVEHLAYQMEGNFLALAQEIDKLALLFGSGPISEDDLEDLLSDNSRFSVYSFVDACVKGDLPAALRILHRLREEGTEPILVTWAVARETRVLLQIALAHRQGAPLERLFAEKKVWSRRKPLVRAALGRLGPDALMALLQQVARMDRMIKGRALGQVWPELETLAISFCP